MIRIERMNLAASLDAYHALPFFPAETSLDGDVRKSVTALDVKLARAVQGIEARDSSADTAVQEVLDQIDVVDQGLSRSIAFDATQGQRLGLSVAQARRSAGRVALALNALAIGLAAFATALAVRSLQQDVRELEQARDSAAERATLSEERSAELEQFSGRVAHDILSPLMGVGIALDLTKLRLVNEPKATETLERGTRSLLRVRRIVDGLLEFARAGARPTGGTSADVAEVVTDVLEGARADAEAAGIELIAQPIASCFVACTPGALTSIISNLVRNAIKHMGDAQTRGITVRVAATDEAVRLEVEDTGPGIPPELEGKVFEPFMRGKSNTDGIGLGLATVKRLAVAHGGRVGCRSCEGAGSTFWFELPRVKAAESAIRLTA